VTSVLKAVRSVSTASVLALKQDAWAYGTCMQVLNVLDAATNRVEREGLSTQHITRPLLLGSYNPDEGQV
jgi:hypothetical protein